MAAFYESLAAKNRNCTGLWLEDKNRMSRSRPLLLASRKNQKQLRAELRVYLCHQLLMSAADWLPQTQAKNYHSFLRVVIRFFSMVEIPITHSRLYNKYLLRMRICWTMEEVRSLMPHNRPYSYSQYSTGTSLQWRLMRGNLFKCK